MAKWDLSKLPEGRIAELEKQLRISETIREIIGDGRDRTIAFMEERMANLIAGAETVLEEWDRGDERAFREAIEEMRADVAAAKGEK